MVLSNKKLKQKLRAEIAKISISDNSEVNPTSIKQLLDSNKPKPRLSKREKRRKTLTLSTPDAETQHNDETKVAHVEGTENRKIKKKRKRESKVSSDEKNELSIEERKAAKREKRKMRRIIKEDGGGELVVKKEKVGDLKKEVKVSQKKKKKKKHKKNKKNKEGVNGAVVEEQSVNENVDYIHSEENAENKKKVYVGGIPFYSTEDDIRSFFDNCGTITDIDCMTFPESGKFRGIAIISFKTEEAAKRALALDGSDMGGLYLKIQPYKAPSTNKTATTDFCPPVLVGYNRIYAGNLSWDITEDDLRKLFSDCKISAIRFGEDKETGEFKGYAHVDFADNVSLTKALKLDQMVVCGRPVRIRCAVPPKKGVVINSGSVPTAVNAEAENNTADTSVMAEAENNTADASMKAEAENNTTVTGDKTSVSSGKLRRRTCYECGEKGHISSDCPKKQGTQEVNPGGS